MLYVKAFGGGQKDEVFLTLCVHICPVVFQGIGYGVGYEAKTKLLFLVEMEFSYQAYSQSLN